MEAPKNLLIIMDIDQCVFSYPKRRSLAEIAYICSEVPPDDILINIEVAFVDTERPDGCSIVEELREYARQYGSIQRIFGFSYNPTRSLDDLLKLATKVEEAGADFVPQFI